MQQSSTALLTIEALYLWIYQLLYKMTTTEIISVINLVGIAAVLPIVLGLLVEKRKKKFESRQELTEVRYKAIILLAHCLINYEKQHLKMIIHRPNIKSKEELHDELKTEWINMALYGSDITFLSMKRLIEDPNDKTFNELVLQMRKELYGIKTTLSLDDLKL